MARVRLAAVTKGLDPFAFALVLATALHILVLGRSLGTAPRVLEPDNADVELEVLDWRDLDSSETARPEHAAEARRLPSTSGQAPAHVPSAGTSDAAPAIAPTTDASVAPAAVQPPPGSDGPANTAKPASRPVRLFLSAADLKELAGRPRTQERGPSRSAALLSQGSESGADVAASASGPAVSAGYRAAQLGPHVGTAVLEVRTDAQGSVTGVHLVGDDESGFWSLVADDLLKRLAKSVLRLPAGAKGMITRLRIDRGYLAEDPAARGKVKRGTALGQERHAKDYGWDESTQASTGPGRLAPTAGVSSESLRTSVPTRVLLLSQQFL